jgi:hypothetical protein
MYFSKTPPLKVLVLFMEDEFEENLLPFYEAFRIFGEDKINQD